MQRKMKIISDRINIDYFFTINNTMFYITFKLV